MGVSSGVAELKALRQVKKDLDAIYKDVVKVLFMEKPDEKTACDAEMKVNTLIMTVGNAIEEIQASEKA